jgi:hypothetical protein
MFISYRILFYLLILIILSFALFIHRKNYNFTKREKLKKIRNHLGEDILTELAIDLL